jgi:PKD repeat protein
VTLVRRRSGKHIVDVVVLKRRHQNLYVGTGHFWIALKCAGQVIEHGGRATEKITVRVTRTGLTGTTPFATAIAATYRNPSRVNLTRCPGGIGRDAATYRGSRVTPLPGPPTAAFVVTPNPAALSASFADQSAPGPSGAPIVSWSWNFGDPASPTNTSASQSPTHQYSAHGTYTVTVQVRDANGQTATATQQVTV